MVKPDDYLTLAQKLMCHEDFPGELKEICLRTSVSRAYYSSFHSVGSFERACPEPPEDFSGGMHAKLIYKLKNCPIPSFQRKTSMDIRRVGTWMSRLRDLRVLADYKTYETVSEKDAEMAMSFCNKINREALKIHSSIYPSKSA